MVAFTEDLNNASALGQAFRPSTEQKALMPLFRKGAVPRYIFRLHSTKTAGRTGTRCVTSPACEAQVSPADTLRQDIFALDPTEAAERLNSHFRWKGHHEDECNLMSWTTSLLFALQLGIFRHHNDYDEPQLDDIHLLILDTKELSPAYFIKDLEVIDVFASRNKELQKLRNMRRKTDYYFGEYLTQGSLTIHGHCAQVSLLQLQELGFFDLLPSLLMQEKNELAKKVLRMRCSYNISHDLPSTRKEVRQTMILAQRALGDRWVIPFSLMILALKPRMPGDLVIVEAFKSMFDKEEIIEALDALQLDPQGLPEVRQLRDLINTIKGGRTFRLEDMFEQLGM